MAEPTLARNIARDPVLRLTTRRIVVSGVLGGIAIFLGVTGLGFVPVPNLTGNATILHVPAILAGVLEGPLVGFLVGAIFGLFSWAHASVPFFKDPSVAVLPRLLIGVVAWGVFAALRRWNLPAAAFVSGFLGSATNTIGVVGMIIVRGYLPKGVSAVAFMGLVLPQAVAEAVIAAIITTVVAEAIYLYRSGRTTAPEIGTGEERRY